MSHQIDFPALTLRCLRANVRRKHAVGAMAWLHQREGRAFSWSTFQSFKNRGTRGVRFDIVRALARTMGLRLVLIPDPCLAAHAQVFTDGDDGAPRPRRAHGRKRAKAKRSTVDPSRRMGVAKRSQERRRTASERGQDLLPEVEF